jgi:hypothetical protein
VHCCEIAHLQRVVLIAVHVVAVVPPPEVAVVALKIVVVVVALFDPPLTR